MYVCCFMLYNVINAQSISYLAPPIIAGSVSSSALHTLPFARAHVRKRISMTPISI